MPRTAHDLNRRQMLASSAAALVAASHAGAATQQAPPASRKVAITIDDGPVVGARGSLEDFLRIAETLRESFVAEQVPVIMFVNERQFNVRGERDARAAVLERWLEAGFDVGNHTYSHLRLGRVSTERFTDDVVKGEVVSRPLVEAADRELIWFRYPFLASGEGPPAQAVEDFLAQRNYKVAPVSVDYHDYRFNRTYMRHVRAGQDQESRQQLESVLTALDFAFARAEAASQQTLGYELPQTLLIHCNELNSLTLPATIQRIRSRNYEFVSLDEAMQDPAYNLPGIRAGGLGGGGLFETLAAARRRAAPGT